MAGTGLAALVLMVGHSMHVAQLHNNFQVVAFIHFTTHDSIT